MSKTTIELDITEAAIVFKADGKPEVYMPRAEDTDRDANPAELSVAKFMLTYNNERVQRIINEEFEKAMSKVE